MAKSSKNKASSKPKRGHLNSSLSEVVKNIQHSVDGEDGRVPYDKIILGLVCVYG